jgi:primosomal protein N' (replication factor Y)
LPTVRVVDLATTNFGTLYPFSPPLLEAIQQRLDCKEQSILFLNRRGIATALLCLNCRERVLSSETALPLTLHRRSDGRPFLMDHVSGDVREVPATCPKCGSANLKAVGAGTQKIEDIVSSVFPAARVLRADRDTLAHPSDIRALLDAMRNRDADILLGTQSVVKGLDLPGVTLSAVLLADVGLSLPSFRAGERVFQLLTQLTGRSGRAQPGEVIIQTFRPSAQEVHLAALHQTEQYLETEMILRSTHRYPPLTQMIRLLFTGPSSRSDAEKAHATRRSEKRSTRRSWTPLRRWRRRSTAEDACGTCSSAARIPAGPSRSSISPR